MARVAIVFAILFAAVLPAEWSDLPQAQAQRGSARQLREGLVVATGTRLVGDVLPNFAPDWTDPDHPVLRLDGWLALFDVNTDALSAIESYREQATRLGYEMQDLRGGQPCDGRPGNVVCGLDFQGKDKRFQVRVSVCRTCEPPVSNGTIRAASLPPDYPAVPTEGVPAAPGTPTARLTPSERRQARTMPEVGEQLFPMPGGFPYNPLTRVERGSEVLGRASFLDTCERDFVSVLTAPSTPRRLFDSYAHTLIGDDAPMTLRTTFSARIVRAASNGLWTIALVDSKKPLLVLDWCA